MAGYGQILEGLEQASERHQKEIVIELGSDRILHFVGVYLVLVLAAVSKTYELDGTVSCYPTKNETGHGGTLVNHAIPHCWESADTNGAGLNVNSASTVNYSRFCKDSDEHNNILVNHLASKRITQWMPYALIIEAFIFAIPSAWWHFMVGARLTGHLKFLKLLLNEIYEMLKIIPAGIYRGKPYDKDGVYLNGWRQFKESYKREDQQGLSKGDVEKEWTERTVTDRETKIYGNKAALTVDWVADVTANARFTDDESDGEGPPSKQSKPKTSASHAQKRPVGLMSEQSEGNLHWKSAHSFCGSCWKKMERIFIGDKVFDKHLFSMLCYENFASLEFHPYIMSVYQLTSTGAAKGDKRGVFPMKQGILRQFCHEDNFHSRYLVKCYLYKYLFRVLSALVMFIAVICMFLTAFVPTFSANTFRCNVPFHDLCFACTFKNYWDFVAIYVMNSVIILIYLGLSTFQYYFVRWGSERALCHYFKDMMDSFSVALLAAHKASR